ncbi:MAG: hypothetical protein KBT10_07455 [Bacteroidales bacterium]|nr:hypothetical protein [Candidatus Sodaliphilus aphodohippi]
MKKILYITLLAVAASCVACNPRSTNDKPFRGLEQDEQGTVYVKENGEKYHLESCEKLEGIEYKTDYIKVTVENARAVGLKPCKKCKPE